MYFAKFSPFIILPPNATTSPDKLNIGIAGYSFGKKVHFEALRESSTLKPLFFYHPNESKCIKIEKETNLKCCSEWDELIKNESLDGIIIATPPEFRYELAKKAFIKEKLPDIQKQLTIEVGKSGKDQSSEAARERMQLDKGSGNVAGVIVPTDVVAEIPVSACVISPIIVGEPTLAVDETPVNPITSAGVKDPTDVVPAIPVGTTVTLPIIVGVPRLTVAETPVTPITSAGDIEPTLVVAD